MKVFSVRTWGALLIIFALISLAVIEQNASSANILPGTIYVDTRGLTERDAKKIGKPLNHPHELLGDVVDKILSSIYYKEKGLLKKETKLAVFTSSEVRALAPLIAEAFSRATASDYVIVYSTLDRVLLSDLHTYCVMFITENEFNVAFTVIRQRLSYNITESEKARIEKLFYKPMDIDKSAFWEILPLTAEGQRLREEHQNWLLIDLGAVTIGKPVAKVKVKEADLGVEPGTAHASELEERVKRLEEKTSPASAKKPEVTDEDVYIRVDVAEDYVPKTPPGSTVEEGELAELKNLDIREKLKRLRTLRDEELITEYDYRSKKAHIIKQEQKNKSIREKLRELRDMRDEGIITEKDYESLKKEILDKWF